MLKPIFKFSISGIIAVGLYLMAAIFAFAWVFFFASKNPADSGESAIMLLVFAMPWIMFVPVKWLGPWAALLCMFINMLVLYFIFGGLRFANHDKQSLKNKSQ